MTVTQMNYQLKHIYFYITEGCNLFCQHCWIDSNHLGHNQYQTALEPALFQEIIKQAKPLGLLRVKLTGGEPLMHPQIHELLRIVRDERVELVIETNGTLCTPEISKLIASCNNPSVAVSLDGADRETHEWVRRTKGSFQNAIEGIQNLVNEGIKPQIIMSLMRRNHGHIEDIIKLSEHLGAGSIKFNPIQPTSRGIELKKNGDTLTIKELIEIRNLIYNSLSNKTNLPLIYTYPLAFRSLHSIFGSERSGGVCGILSVLGVLSDGSYALCGIGTVVPNLIFGHAEKDLLKDVWEKSFVLNQLREGLPKKLEGICAKCIMKGVCLGSCIAQNYYRGQSLWKPFWFCEEADKAGLFPTSRKY
jgi:SynChlorMet cassette radical SAM/SPASM protein ScmF